MTFAAYTTWVEVSVTFSPAYSPLMSARARIPYLSRGSKNTPVPSVAVLPARLMAAIPAGGPCA
jgi:hypothetical protein